MITYNSSLIIKKEDFTLTRIQRSSLPPLQKGQILLKIYKFGLSANNITYLAMGKSYKYFDFFPVENEDEFAICPTWGLGTVVESSSKGIKTGEKIYGYFPMSQYCILEPSGMITDLFFHVSRPYLPDDRRVYNQYFRSEHDPDYVTDQEDHMILFRPLWTTSFFIDDFLNENQLFGAKEVLISSASSKTSYCLALILKTRGIKPIGLTSTGNVQFVKGLGWYKKVVDYDDITKMDNSKPVVYVDTAGSTKLNAVIHKHFGKSLVKHVGLGISHFSQDDKQDSKNGSDEVDLSKFEMFFAPAWIKFRMPRAKEELVRRKEKAWKDLLKEAHNCVKLVHGEGYDNAVKIYHQMLSGKAKADEGYIVSLWETNSKL